MRHINDIETLEVTVHGTVEVDWERIEADPLWDTVARTFDMGDPLQRKAALEAYVCRYLGQENLLENAPVTNGPASIIATSAEVILKCRP